MTAISALISKKWIAAASDSLLTEFYPDNNKIEHKEFRKSKIVPIRKFKAAASYWGLAKIGKWRTYDFLKSIASQADNYDTFENFALGIRDKLNKKLDGYSFQNPVHKGIGIHLIGYELFENKLIPELFLISNYTNPSYENIGELGVSRNLYKTLPEDFRNNEQTLIEQRKKVLEFLEQDRLFIFNNGDPVLFNPAANAIHKMFNSAIERNVLKFEPDYMNFMKLASKPIEFVKLIQSSFFEKDYIRIGGKIHHLLITPTGSFISNTGDNEF